MLKNFFSVLLLFLLLGCALNTSSNKKSEKQSDSQILDKNPINTLDVVISEVAWAGTDISFTDEWIELHNNTSENINLKDWCVKGDLEIDLTGDIPAGKYFLLERTDELTVPDKTADLIYTGSLSNTGAQLYLLYNDVTIDQVVMSPWAAGSNDPKISMERKVLDASGDDNNWQNGLGDIEGAKNSLD